MKDQIRRERNMMLTVIQFGEDHPQEPENPAAAAEYAAIAAGVSQLDDLGESQEVGKGTFSGAIDQRHILVDNLLSLMRSLSKAAKTLDKTVYPDVATKMQMGGIANLQQLMQRASVFHSTLTPIVAQFTAMGASATVGADLQAMITAVQTAINLKSTGRDMRLGGTTGLGVVARATMKRVRKLDAILSQVYRTNPILLAQWKAARRVQRAPVTEPAPEESPAATPAPPSGS